MGGCILVVGALPRYALLYSVDDLKATQMNVQRSQIWELLRYEFKLGHNPSEATKNICFAKGEGAVDHQFSNQMVEDISPLGL